MKSAPRLVFSFLAVIASLSACTNILGGFTFANGTGGTGTGGSATGASGTGAGTCATRCSSDDNCTASGDCTAGACVAGCCTTKPLASGTMCGTGGHCDGKGTCAECVLSSDCTAPATKCVTVACASGACVKTDSAMGASCSDQSGTVCDGAGTCVACNTKADCPKSSTACIVVGCSASSCTMTDAPLGTSCTDNSGVVCDGHGTCTASHCKDGVQDADETGLDCGGSTCPACADGLGCKVTKDCQSGFCNAGTCNACAADGNCATGSFCATANDGGTCVGTNPVGAACTAGDQCASGSCAPDGVCCSTACSGTCQGCASAHTGLPDGTCGPFMVGVTAPAGQCPTSATSVCASDGTCAAGGACNYPSTTVSCGIGCSGDTSGAFSCDGAGNCSGAGHALHRCANNFVCASPTACATSCTTDAQCQPGYFCQNAACIAAQAIGAACTGVDQCASGFCVGGYCCNTACTTECNSCDGTLTGGSNGVCTTVRDGVSDPQGTCPISPDGTCGTSGQCVGGACGLKGSGWECPGTCSNNIETLGFCDGAGNCNISTSTNSCAPNGCAATGCATSCQTSADCASPAVCFNNTCIRVAALAIGPGGSHTCALRYGGVVNCWGAGTLGQLGNGATANSSVPVSVSVITTLDSTTRLCAGDNHTCALLSGGSVYCWGNNASGQLGTNPATTSISPTPISVGGLPGSITSLACGGSHTCALTSTGAVWCWGANASGQLGNGSLTATFNPTQVSNITTASGVVGGEAHTCALTGSGVQCWGLNANGQLGNGSTISSSTPVTVTGLSAKSLAAGAQHNCAVTSTGGVSCWGLGSSGQCGNAVQNNTAPVAVTNSGGSALTGVVAVAAGTSQTCAVLTGGGVACWGSDIDGNLGNGMTTQSSTPVTPSGPITGATAVAGGLYHTCAITNGTVDCWGFNGSGQLGNNTTTQSLTPVTVSGP